MLAGALRADRRLRARRQRRHMGTGADFGIIAGATTVSGTLQRVVSSRGQHVRPGGVRETGGEPLHQLARKRRLSVVGEHQMALGREPEQSMGGCLDQSSWFRGHGDRYCRTRRALRPGAPVNHGLGSGWDATRQASYSGHRVRQSPQMPGRGAALGRPARAVGGPSSLGVAIADKKRGCAAPLFPFVPML